MPIDITEFADAVNSGLADGTPNVLVTVGADGSPDIGLKGSMMVFDKDHLAYWERTLGGHFSNLKQSVKVAVNYFNRDRRQYLRFFGEATVHDEGSMRQEIMRRTIPVELDRDPERRGVGVLIEVTKVIDAFGRRTLTRDD